MSHKHFTPRESIHPLDAKYYIPPRDLKEYIKKVHVSQSVELNWIHWTWHAGRVVTEHTHETLLLT